MVANCSADDWFDQFWTNSIFVGLFRVCAFKVVVESHIVRSLYPSRLGVSISWIMPWKSVICNGLSFSSFHLFSISILLPFCCCFKMIQITWFGSLGWSALCPVPSPFLYFIPSVTVRLKKNEKAGWETLVKEDKIERVGRGCPNGNEKKKVPGWRWW